MVIVRTVPLCLASIVPILLPLNKNENKIIEDSSRLICDTSPTTYLHQCSGYTNTSICYWSMQSKKV